ncbi:MAG: hypothetical protein AAFU79_34505, partial [Myxococcota bacterium]
MLALLVLISIAGSGPSLRVADFHGSGGDTCSARVREIFAGFVPAVSPDPGLRLPTSGRFERLRRAVEREKVDVVVHGFVRPHKLVVEAYAAQGARLLGVNEVRTAGRCGLTPRGRRALERWWRLLAQRFQGWEPFTS